MPVWREVFGLSERLVHQQGMVVLRTDPWQILISPQYTDGHVVGPDGRLVRAVPFHRAGRHARAGVRAEMPLGSPNRLPVTGSGPGRGMPCDVLHESAQRLRVILYPDLSTVLKPPRDTDAPVQLELPL